MADEGVTDIDAVDVDTAALLPALRRWWAVTARDLPWRRPGTSAWGVLVSEVMSQQTPMSRVVPYWQTWMEAWPTPAALAAPSTAEVLTAWGGLGYPRRALRLQECARVLARDFGGQLPADYETLLSLPGVGDYTAAAVSSFAFGRRVAVIDTNIRRVLSRAVAGQESYGGSASAAERALADRLLPADPADSVRWNQAVMELGALVCTASSPHCEDCPLADCCRWRAADYPGLGQKRTRSPQKWQGTDRQVRGIILKALRQRVQTQNLEGGGGRLVVGQAGTGGRSPLASQAGAGHRGPVAGQADADLAGRSPLAGRDAGTGAPAGSSKGPRAVTAARPVLTMEELLALWPNQAQLQECVAALDDDRLIEILPDGSVAFPL